MPNDTLFSPIGALATTAVGCSAINLAGGFNVSSKMISLFDKKDDTPDYSWMTLVPFGAATAALMPISMTLAMPGYSGPLLEAASIGSGLACIGAIGSMAHKDTAKRGLYLGIGGTALGTSCALMSLEPVAQISTLGVGALFGGLGYAMSKHIGPTQLPQAVAGYHALVGVAATSTATGELLLHAPSDPLTLGLIGGGAALGAFTVTGSLVACGKLAEMLPAKPLQFSMIDGTQAALGMACASSVAAIAGGGVEGVLSPMGALGTSVVSSGALGYLMTSRIGGADMPVVISLLNSYSGWALCAEGFLLDKPILTMVGSLIGASGAFLTKVMCDGMNRDLGSVILLDMEHRLLTRQVFPKQRIMEFTPVSTDGERVCWTTQTRYW